MVLTTPVTSFDKSIELTENNGTRVVENDGSPPRIAIIALVSAVLVLVIFGIKKLGSSKGSSAG